MSPGRRREMVDRERPKLPIVQRCALLGVSRSRLCCLPIDIEERMQIIALGIYWEPVA